MAISAPTLRRGKVEEMNDGPREHVPLARHSIAIAPCNWSATRVEDWQKRRGYNGEKDEGENFVAEREKSGGEEEN